MTIAYFIATAIGGGIVASALEAWFANMRAYETARLLVLAELMAIVSLSRALAMPSSQPYDPSRVSYPTEAWRQNGTLLVTRLARFDPRLFAHLSGVFTTLESARPNGPLDDGILGPLQKARHGLSQARLGLLGETVVYGPRHAVHRYRRRRAGEARPEARSV